MKRNRILLALTLVIALATPIETLAQQWSTKGPAPRGFHSAVLDTITNSMVIFGGTTYAPVGSGNPGLNLNDTWRLSNATTAASALSWTQLKPTGTPPAPRATQTAIYAPESDSMIIFGGGLNFSSPCVNDVWALKGVSGTAPAWTELSPVGGPPAARQ